MVIKFLKNHVCKQISTREKCKLLYSNIFHKQKHELVTFSAITSDRVMVVFNIIQWNFARDRTNVWKQKQQNKCLLVCNNIENTGEINIFYRKPGGFLPLRNTQFNPQSNWKTSAPHKIYGKHQIFTK